jgi:hypothetical protein
MMKLFFLTICFLVSHPIQAQEQPGDSDEAFMKVLEDVKNPFEDGLPKPKVIKKFVPPPPPLPKPKVVPKPILKLLPSPPVTLPALSLQGVIVGEEMHEAVINGQIVSLNEEIQGAKVIGIGKKGVTLLYKEKIFFLKID